LLMNARLVEEAIPYPYSTAIPFNERQHE